MGGGVGSAWFGPFSPQAPGPTMLNLEESALCIAPVANVAADKFDKLHPKCTQLCKARQVAFLAVWWIL